MTQAATRPPRLSLHSRVLYATFWLFGRTVGRFVPITHPKVLRAAEQWDAHAGRRKRMPRGITVTPVQLDGFEAEWLRPEGAVDDAAILYFHGGGFFSGGLNTHRPAVSAMAKRSKVPAFSVAYRQLPSTPINGSVADCLAAYRHLLGTGLRPERIVFAGDSAGGYLTFATALKARDEGLPLPAGLVALSPVTDLEGQARSKHANWGKDTYILAKHLSKAAELWSTDPDGQGPPISPVRADLTGMPPTLIMAAETEVLLADAEAMAEALWAAGAECKLEVWRGQVHAFPVLAPTPEVRLAVGHIAEFIQQVLKAS
ncbi:MULTISPECIES: alpha/beta hydrolase [Thermocrispum]|jgi:acetyl esterase/lipase|uniref:Alpha/beta hydrolase n=1 Tax=Thermocrispum agreste TaxID=37925 RepID=A0A2W4JTD5_9PSEU|nr:MULTISPECIES: alpha/beta hydrolase [Thermocrispum]PZM97007.1 MAG: alpha/beta hydrolase [Thermocrispum agreste]